MYALGESTAVKWCYYNNLLGLASLALPPHPLVTALLTYSLLESNASAHFVLRAGAFCELTLHDISVSTLFSTCRRGL